MKVNKEELTTPDGSHRCGKIYDPLAEAYIDTCNNDLKPCCGHAIEEDDQNQSFYLGACGLISAYLL
jgi:hypothetical protein